MYGCCALTFLEPVQRGRVAVGGRGGWRGAAEEAGVVRGVEGGERPPQQRRLEFRVRGLDLERRVASLFGLSAGGSPVLGRAGDRHVDGGGPLEEVALRAPREGRSLAAGPRRGAPLHLAVVRAERVRLAPPGPAQGPEPPLQRRARRRRDGPHVRLAQIAERLPQFVVCQPGGHKKNRRGREHRKRLRSVVAVGGRDPGRERITDGIADRHLGRESISSQTRDRAAFAKVAT